MAGTTTRALALLNLLQTHRAWTGPELASRLAVSERTLRRDVERLRDLGYRIESAPGADGGYRLEAGSAVPPLLLTDEEAVTMAVGLRLAAIQRLVDGPETSLSALAKLEQVLPARLRRRVNALAGSLQPIGPDGPLVSPEVLGELALACRDRERLRFAYTAADGASSRRHVEPYAVVPAERAWYLVTFDLVRDDWRTFRVDRLDELRRTGARFAARELPADDLAAYVAAATYTYTALDIGARVVLDLPLEGVRAAFGPWSRGAEALDDEHTSWPIAASLVPELLFGLAWVPEGVDYTIEADDDVRAQLHEIAARLLEATRGGRHRTMEVRSHD